MCWDKAAIREDRQQAYFDSILMAVSEAGGQLTRQRLLALVARDLRAMGNTAWHVDRMVSTMIREGCLIRKKGLLSLNSPPDAQRTR
jgi:hypothetical protein